MSIPLIVTAGYGNGALTGTIKGVVLRGYDIGEAVSALKGFGVFSLIDDSGVGLSSAIDITGQGVESSITASFGVISLVDNSGEGLVSPIDVTGKGVESDI